MSVVILTTDVSPVSHLHTTEKEVVTGEVGGRKKTGATRGDFGRKVVSLRFNGTKHKCFRGQKSSNLLTHQEFHQVSRDPGAM